MRSIVPFFTLLISFGCSSSAPTDSAEPSAPPAPVARLTAIQLSEEYISNPLAADAKYKGKRVEVTGSGKVARGSGDRYNFEFQTVALAALPEKQLALLPPREQEWFRSGAYPSNVVAEVARSSEENAAKVKPGDQIVVVGTVLGSRKADVWKDVLVELGECQIRR